MVTGRISSDIRAYLDKFQTTNYCNFYNQAHGEGLSVTKPGAVIKKRSVTNNLFLKLALLLISLGLILNVQPVSAKTHRVKDKDDNTDPVTVQVLPQLPTDNIGGDHLGYFNLPMSAGKARQETIDLYNPTNQVIQVHVKTVNATTNDNGTIDYFDTKPINQRLLKRPASKMIKTPKQLKIQPQAMAKLIIKINPGQTSFIGQKAAAINITAKGINDAHSSIQSQYVYAIGIVLQGKRLKPKTLKKLRPTDIKVRIRQDKKAAISIKLANPDATYLKNSTIKMRLLNQKYYFFRYQNLKKSLKVAPSSDFYNDLLLGEKRLVPGVYSLMVTVKSDQYQHTTYKYVEITKDQARFINSHNYLYLKYRNRILLGLGGLVMAIIVSVILGKRQRLKKRKKDLNE